jgi:hypothetical protein
MASLQNRGLDETDGALVLITPPPRVPATTVGDGHYGPLTAEELCNKPL